MLPSSKRCWPVEEVVRTRDRMEYEKEHDDKVYNRSRSNHRITNHHVA